MGKKKKQFSSSLVLQLLISIAYSAMLVHMTVILVRGRSSGWITALLLYLPQLAIIISSLSFLFILRLRHWTHSIDSTLLPLLFTFIALESTMIIPLYTEVTGITLFAPNVILIVERFAVLSAAIIFVFTSIQFFGTNVSRLKLYLVLALGSALYIAVAMPINTGNTDLSSMALFSSSYDAMLLAALIAIYLVSIITYIAAVANDRSTHSISRATAFILMMIGNFFSISNGIMLSILAAVLYIVGIVMLTITSKSTF